MPISLAERTEAETKRLKTSLSGFVRQTIEDYFDLFGMPQYARQVLEADRKKRQMTTREYVQFVLGQHYDHIK